MAGFIKLTLDCIRVLLVALVAFTTSLSAQMPVRETTEIEVEVECTIVYMYEENDEYFACVKAKDFNDTIQITESQFYTWEIGDTIGVGVGYSYDV